MAIFHLTTHTMSRAAGHSAVAAAAYRAAEKLVDERTGEVFDFTRKAGVLSAEIVVPEGSSAPDRESLWNAAEAAEKRKDSRTAREWRVALPHELNEAERKALATQLGQALAGRYGVAVDVCIHAPDKNGDDRNYHAHMLATTRRIDAEGKLGAKATIELANKDRAKLGISGTSQSDLVDIRREWAELTNQALERAGLGERIDHRSFADQGVPLTATRHVGGDAMAMDRRGKSAERIDIHSADQQEQARQIIERPEILLDKITGTKAVFNRRDIATELARYIDDKDQFQTLLVKLENSPQLIELEPAKGREPARYSTREFIEVERRMADGAERLAKSGKHRVSETTTAAAINGAGTLSAEQQRAVQHVCGGGSLAVVIGDAGTGKSFSMKVAREAWEAQGFTVRGAALAGKAADELQAGSGIKSRTLASLEHAWKQGRDKLESRDVLVIDEAGMVGSRQLGRVLAAAEKAGAKVVLLGDDKQLAAIEAGAALRAVVQHVGATEITEVRRQRHAWAREAGQAFARGSVSDGLQAYSERDFIKLHETRKSAREALANAYVADKGLGSQIILAHANADVLMLNDAVREARKDKGELVGSARFMTERGGREFSTGDRVVFLKNDVSLGVKNGTLGSVKHAQDGRLEVLLDSGETRFVEALQYSALDHGYAVTIHKAQGVTVDRAYLLATPGMDRSLTYVGMTRHREAATMFAAKDDFTDKRAGTLLSHGSAPYEHDPKNATSYFVSLQNTAGQIHTVWGVDLQRAITQSGAKLGEHITLARTGAETVQLSEGKTAERNLWQVNGSEQLSTAALAKALSRERVKESTLDFANRRELDGESIMRRCIELGRAKLEKLATRAKKAIDYAKENISVGLFANANKHGLAPQAAPVRKSTAELAAEHAKAKLERQGDTAKKPERSPEPQGKHELQGKPQRAALQPSDEHALDTLLQQRTAERTGRAARLMASLERTTDKNNQALRTHQQNQPEAPRGLSAMLGGKAKHAKDLANWQQRTQQLSKRSNDLHRRLKTVAKIAQGPFDARRLALAKLKRDAPELVMRAEILRGMKLSDAQKQQREAIQKQQQTQISPTRSRGR
jgi:Ti-type conjugative transfer relaxase TraA